MGGHRNLLASTNSYEHSVHRWVGNRRHSPFVKHTINTPLVVSPPYSALPLGGRSWQGVKSRRTVFSDRDVWVLCTDSTFGTTVLSAILGILA